MRQLVGLISDAEVPVVTAFASRPKHDQITAQLIAIWMVLCRVTRGL